MFVSHIQAFTWHTFRRLHRDQNLVDKYLKRATVEYSACKFKIYLLIYSSKINDAIMYCVRLKLDTVHDLIMVGKHKQILRHKNKSKNESNIFRLARHSILPSFLCALNEWKNSIWHFVLTSKVWRCSFDGHLWDGVCICTHRKCTQFLFVCAIEIIGFISLQQFFVKFHQIWTSIRQHTHTRLCVFDMTWCVQRTSFAIHYSLVFVFRSTEVSVRIVYRE